MKEIIKLILKYHFTIIFILLEIISFSLIIRHNEYQRAIFLKVLLLYSGIFRQRSRAKRLFSSKKEMNESLANENILLKNRLESMSFYEIRLSMVRLYKIVYLFTSISGQNRSMRHITGRKITLL